MFEYLIGLVTVVTPAYVVLEVNGVGYLLQTANPYRFQEDPKKNVKIYVYQAVRDTDINLFGFVDSEEKQLFLKLLNVSGIGPKSALAILANEDHGGLISAITNNDVKYLTKFPGIGKKTAQQIVLDLQGKLGDIGIVTSATEVETGPTVNSSALRDALAALSALGYSGTDVKRVAKKLDDNQTTSTDAYLSKALRLLTQA
ncbi:MAG: Holliday junction branch migration protein RuvA [Furfurilactobacillus sp.]|jgi:Holliday junction DNA helicase RuvA|uniref:Holliday junction branch migration protein RuvA n=1 Tax=Furfurilactobacillus sp. TaxID=2767911 RepID=UPI002590C2EC|nr:Holliday junction branch migration protein RuvA [Furfurilactobacillus sp.]MCH4011122.1 Holliday junction branch migration protein RuvA [Furfurilactobacillus sp.]MCH4037014.1 Holliday junction branch migration protein RuvA [Furfurilactobacillus sp.]MCH4114040.1 Holliday junction branch migration protein RuvA [Furfurilactobacillus sp.]MCH4133276.1 Holliday junction branch migration protein RuvA [Furfurilactobacillus sp.]MCI1340751.1 Holliday junction branch migration protein RuvA [Furfurilact